jgi:uncharacterized protein YdiU (UPF0061 family)
MINRLPQQITPTVAALDDLAKLANYSLMDTLNCDPYATGHYVPVNRTPIQDPEYVMHSKNFFHELGFSDSMAQSADFVRMFSGDLTDVPEPLRKVGWATGYALSIFGSEYYEQCPFQTGNGCGEGRAISVLEAVIKGQCWEMQLKGGGRTPYCRGADGRAVLHSSVREFLAKECMHSFGVPLSRSLSLYVSKTEKVSRPFYSEDSRSQDPDRLITEAIAISAPVAPTFIRVGQAELFSRCVRKQEHQQAIAELEMIVLHLINREYSDGIDNTLSKAEKLGLHKFNTGPFRELETLMAQTAVDCTILFRELSTVADNIGPLKKSFYINAMYNADPEGMDSSCSEWFTTWKSLNASITDANTARPRSQHELSRQMKLVNPKYNLREWFVVAAYQQASIVNYSLVRELKEVMTQPYAEQSIDVEEKYYRLKPLEFFETGGLSHYSCWS